MTTSQSAAFVAIFSWPESFFGHWTWIELCIAKYICMSTWTRIWSCLPSFRISRKGSISTDLWRRRCHYWDSQWYRRIRQRWKTRNCSAKLIALIKSRLILCAHSCPVRRQIKVTAGLLCRDSDEGIIIDRINWRYYYLYSPQPQLWPAMMTTTTTHTEYTQSNNGWAVRKKNDPLKWMAFVNRIYCRNWIILLSLI